MAVSRRGTDPRSLRARSIRLVTWVMTASNSLAL
jgi:hypothetical protein